MATGADGPIRASVILANRSGVNAGERFSLGISEESIWLGPHSEILGASEYKPIVLAIPGVRPRLAKYVARIGLFVTPVTSHREWLRYSSVSWFERLSPSPPTPPPLETTKLRPPSAPPLGGLLLLGAKKCECSGDWLSEAPTYLPSGRNIAYRRPPKRRWASARAVCFSICATSAVASTADTSTLRTTDAAPSLPYWRWVSLPYCFRAANTSGRFFIFKRANFFSLFTPHAGPWRCGKRKADA